MGLEVACAGVHDFNELFGEIRTNEKAAKIRFSFSKDLVVATAMQEPIREVKRPRGRLTLISVGSRCGRFQA